MHFENEKITYRNIVRGLTFHEGRVLMARDKNQGHYFPPGGGVEFGESAKRALERELLEELDWKIKANQFAGCLEHSWVSKKENFEMNFYFKMSVADGDLNNPTSKEDHLEFSWIDLGELDDLPLFPKQILPTIIRNAHKPNHEGTLWFSTLE